MADYGALQWSPDGKPFINDWSGKKVFITPIVAAQYKDDPKAQAWAASQGAHIGAAGGSDTVTGAPDATTLKSRGTWNPDTGQYDQGVNWDNVLSMATGGFVGAGALDAAFAGGAGAAAAPTAASSTAAATPAAAGTTGGAVAGGGGILSTVKSAANLIKNGTDAYSGLSDILGGAAKSNVSQGNAADALKIGLANATTNRQSVASKLPATRLATAARAALMGAPPSTVTWGGPGSGLKGQIPVYSGFADANKAVTDGTKDIAPLVGADQLAAQKAGGPTGGNTDMTANMPTGVGNESGLSQTLGGGALVTALLAALNKGSQPPPPQGPNEPPGSGFANGSGDYPDLSALGGLA